MEDIAYVQDNLTELNLRNFDTFGKVAIVEMADGADDKWLRSKVRIFPQRFHP